MQGVTSTYRLSRLLCVAATLTFAVAHVNEAQARRCHRSRCAPCCNRDCGGHYGDNYTCVQFEVYEIGPNDYLYYADFYEGGCDVESQPVYIEGPAYDLYERCEYDECIRETRYGQKHPAGTMPHAVGTVFQGFEHPLEPNFPTHWPAGVTQVGTHFESLHILQENKIYKVQVFDLRLDKRPKKTIHVAFEISHFPTGENPSTIPLGSGNVKTCAGNHAYSLNYRGKKLLLLTAR